VGMWSWRSVSFVKSFAKGTVLADGQWWIDEQGMQMASMFMKYDSDSFMNVWLMTVLLTIKSEMNILRSGYALAMKNHVIRGT
jgi:hypothetical protein